MTIPTTEQVRSLYSYNALGSGNPPQWVLDRQTAFDLWLEGIKAEQREKDAQTAEGLRLGHGDVNRHTAAAIRAGDTS